MVEAEKEWEWWAPKAANVIFQGIFAGQTYEEAVETIRPWWYILQQREAETAALQAGGTAIPGSDGTSPSLTSAGGTAIPGSDGTSPFLPSAGATLILIVVGTLFIYSSGMSFTGMQLSNEYMKQLIWAGSGLLLMIGAILIDYHRLRSISMYLYGLTVLLLLVTSFVGREVHGARSWIGVGEFGIQPSESSGSSHRSLPKSLQSSSWPATSPA